jgi:hypothetical protein
VRSPSPVCRRWPGAAATFLLTRGPIEPSAGWTYYSNGHYAPRRWGISKSYALATKVLGADPRSPKRDAAGPGPTEVLNPPTEGAHTEDFSNDPNVRRRTDTNTA